MKWLADDKHGPMSEAAEIGGERSLRDELVKGAIVTFDNPVQVLPDHLLKDTSKQGKLRVAAYRAVLKIKACIEIKVPLSDRESERASERCEIR